MKKWIVILLTSVMFLLAQKASGQVYTQTFINKCTGKEEIATTTYVNGNAVVSFYNQIKVFTPTQVTNGELQAWLQSTYATYNSMVCPTPPTVTTTVQQTVTQAAAQAASAAASRAASSAASGAASGAASSSASSASASAASSSSASSSSSSQSSSSSGSTSSSTSSGESKSGGSSSSSESKSESKTESKSETKEESKSEEKKEEKKEDKKEEKKEDKKEDKKKQARMNPMMLGSDLTVGQNATGGFTPVISLSVNQASVTGESSWGVSTLIWADLKSVALSANKSDMIFKDGALKAIKAYSYTIAYVAGTHMTFGGYTWIKPHPKLGTFGYNLSYINIKLKGATMEGKINYSYSFMSSITAFWTKPYQLSTKSTLSPGVFIMSSPYTYNSESGPLYSHYITGLVGTGYNFKLSKRFGFNLDYKASFSTAPGVPILSYFLIGSRMVL